MEEEEGNSLNGSIMKLSPMRILLGGYCTIVLIGTLLLCLPISARDGMVTPVSDALFTATSAACVTGLVRFDTFTHWSLFGQLVILLLIQVGGMGFVTIILFMNMLSKQRIGLHSRILMRDAISAPNVGGIVRMTRFILTGTFLIELCGALALAFYFCPRLGLIKGLYYSVFHSISAFCNAGFDLMGFGGKFSSLTSMADNWYVNLVFITLITVSGLGFFVWQDILQCRGKFSKMTVQSRLVLVVSAVLTFGGAAALFLMEYSGTAFAGMSVGDKALASLFQSVTMRTAGFNTINLADFKECSLLLMIILMLVGGSTGSTAGGMKTTTFAVLILGISTTFRRRKNVECFGRRLEDGIARTASCIFMMYLFLMLGSAMVISCIENLPILTVLFETASAVATVGVTLGITSELSMISKLILVFLMLFGRAGSMTMLLAFSAERGPIPSKKPLEKIQIG